jgi:Kef-type K+ transport system membrane component KefB
VASYVRSVGEPYATIAETDDEHRKHVTPFPEIAFPFDHPVLIFATVMAMILIAPQVMTRLKLPGLVGLIAAGAIAGPSAFNFLERDPTMVLLGTIGLLYLMFLAGISLDLDRFNKLRGRSLVFGLMSFFIPQLMALAVAMPLLGMGWSAALLLGSIVGSHTLVAYPIASRLGLTKNTAVTMTIGGTLVTDTISLAILAVVVVVAGGASGSTFWLSFGGMVAAYLLCVLFVLPRVGYWFFHTVRNRPELEFAFLMTSLFGTAYLAYYVGLAPIIGAFLAGLALNRLIPERSILMARVKFTGEALFIPFFLISVGLLIDFRELRSLKVWGLALVLIALVTVGKWAAAKLIERAYKYSKSEGWLIFGLSTPQAAATLAVTLIGFEIGLFDTSMVNAVVLLILVTCILGPALVEKHGLTLAHEEEADAVVPTTIAERIMVPLANPKTSAYLFDLAILMRDPKSEAPIFPLMVVSEGDKIDERLRSKQEQLKLAAAMGAEAEVPVTPLIRIDANIAHGIARAAREETITTILIGWNGEVSTRERIFGSVLDQLLDETRQMIFVNKLDNPLNTIARVVLAIPPFAEHSPGFFEALQEIKQLTSRVGARLDVICEGRYLDHDRRFVASIEPKVATQFHCVEHWSDVGKELEKHVDEHTHIVVMSARRGTPPWFAELDEIPRTVAKNYPDRSFTIVYLSAQ